MYKSIPTLVTTPPIMKNPVSTYVFSLLALILCTRGILMAQDVEIGRIEERRSSSTGFFSNQCTLYFSVRNLGENPTQYVRIGEIKKAVDSKGNTLINPENSKWSYESAASSNLKIDLMSPAREASTIQELSGNFRFFTPSESNGSIVKVPKFTALTDKNLLPSKAGLKLTYLSPEVIKKKGEELKKMREEELARMDGPARELAEGILGIFEGFTSWGDNYHNVHFMTEGDAGKLIDIEFINAKGEKVDTNGKSSSENQITYYFNTEPAKDWALRILYETPKSVKTVPFSFKDLKLP